MSDLEVRDWVFTFGHGQRCYSLGRYDRRAERGPAEQVEGFRLDDRYVVMRNMTHQQARREMAYRFGEVWAFDYPSLDAAGVDRFHLTELVVTEDWPPGLRDDIAELVGQTPAQAVLDAAVAYVKALGGPGHADAHDLIAAVSEYQRVSP